MIRIHHWAYVVCGAVVALVLAAWGIQQAMRPPFSGVNRADKAPLPGTVLPASSASANSYLVNGGQAAAPKSNESTMDSLNATLPPATGMDNAPPMPVGDPTTGLVSRNVANLGNVVTDGSGFTLYRFDGDTANPPTATCADACATTWQPVLTGNGMPGLQGIDAKLVGTVTRTDGGVQATLAGWPLYRYTGDRQPGTSTGQGVNGAWWVAAPTGEKNLAGFPMPPSATPTAPLVDGGNDPAPSHW